MRNRLCDSLLSIPCAVLLSMISRIASDSSAPHIVFIMVDDMGWSDVSYLQTKDQIITSNIDALALRSVILQQYYSEAICTPARTALLTGKYPMRLGMHGMPLYNGEDRGIPLTERLLPSYFKDLGYSTHLVGKWHVGMSKKQYLPTSRGYDSHYGMRGGFVDYYTYFKVETWPDGKEYSGLDLFDDDVPQDQEDRYATDALTQRAVDIINNHNTSRPLFLHLAFTAPHAGNDGSSLQPPLNVKLQNDHIAHSDRRLYAEMVNHLDQCVGTVVKTLADRGILGETIIVFVSDNGAPTVKEFSNRGVNLPFRGKKQTPWEGGVRVPAFIWHSSLTPGVWKGMMHITDWLPTLIAAAGGAINKDIDGVNQWDSLMNLGKSKRNEVLIAIENDERNAYAAYRAGNYKIIVGNVSGLTNGHYGADYLINKAEPPDYFSALRSSSVTKVFESMGSYLSYDEVMAIRRASVIRQWDRVRDLNLCEPNSSKGCLYNVREDPSERHDLWQQGYKIRNVLLSRLRSLWSMQMKRGPSQLDSRSDPANFHYTWLPWLNDTEIPNTEEDNESITEVVKDFGEYNIPWTPTEAVSCEQYGDFRNFLCLLRSVF